jgi:hypothetical protein
MKKQTQTKKRQNRSRSKKVTRSKKYNKKSNRIGGAGINERPPIFLNGNIFNIYRINGGEFLGQFKLNYIMVNYDTGMAESYHFKSGNNLMVLTQEQMGDYRFEMTYNDYPDAVAQ